MHRSSFSSSRFGLIVLVCLALLPMLGLILYDGSEQHLSAARQAEGQIFTATQQFSAEYGRLVEGTHQMLAALSQVDVIRNPQPAACQALLAQLVAQFPQYANIGSLDENGNVVCSAVALSGPVNLKDRAYFQRAVQTRTFSTGDYQVGRITKRQAVNFGYPILDSANNVRGVVFAAVDLMWMSHLAQNVTLPAGASFSLVDRRGTILIRYPNPGQWVGKQLGDQALLNTIQAESQGTTEGVGVDGGQRLVGFIRLLGSPEQLQTVTALVSEPSELAFAAANQSLITNLIGFGIVALIAILTAWGGAYLFLLRQIDGVVQAMRRLAAGDLTTRTGFHMRLQEWRELGIAFDAMAAALQQQRAEIDAALEALRSSEAHYRSLVEMSPEGILIYSNWKIVFINATGARMFGADRPEQLIGVSVLDVTHPDSKEIAEKRGHQLLEERVEVPLLEERIQRVDGTVLDVEVIACPCTFNGQSAAQVIVHDITERKQAEAARLRWTEEIQALYQTSLELTGQLDLTALLAGISERAARLLGAQIGAVYLVSLQEETLELVAGDRLPQGMLGLKLKLGEGISGLAAQTGEFIQVGDDQTLEAQADRRETLAFGHVLAVPMKARSRVIGVITVIDDRRSGPYGPEETRLAQLFADQAAIAVDNARLYETAQRELAERERSEAAQRRLVDELSALHAVSLAGIEAVDLDELTERVTQIIGERFYPDDFGIGFLNEASGVIDFHSSYRIRTGAVIPSIHLGVGVSGWVAQHRQPRRIGDVRSVLDYLDADPEVRSEVCVPIVHGDRVLGVINAESHLADAFSPADERLLTALARELGIAIEKLRLIGQECRRRQEAETLRLSTAALTSTLDLGRVIEQILDCLGQVVHYDSTSIMLVSGDRLEVTAERGFPTGFQRPWLSDISVLRHISEVLERGRPLIIPDTSSDPRWIQRSDGIATRCWMGVPLVVKERVIGLVNLGKTEPHFYQPEDAELAMAFANQAALAIENARLFASELQRNRELAAVDKVSVALRAAPTPVEMMPIILDQVIDLLGVEAAAMIMYDANAREIKMELARGLWASSSGTNMPYESSTIARLVLNNGQPYLDNEVQDNPALIQAENLKDLRAIFGAPLIMHSTTVGVLEVGRKVPFSESDTHLTVAIAELAANAMHRAQLHEQTVQRLNRLTILRKVDMAITASMDFTITLNILLEEMLTGLRLDAADVLLFNTGSYSLEWAAGKGFDATALIHARSGLPALTLLGPDLPQVRAILDRQSVLVDDLRQVGSERLRWLAQDGFLSSMVLPLVAKGEVRGLLEVFQRAPLRQDRETIDFIESLAGQAAIALDNAELFDHLERTNLELSLAYDATIEGWARALDLRNEDTEKHSYRVVEKTIELARVMGVSDPQLVHIRRGAFLHDIGKMAIPDEVMNKPGPLTEPEWEIMRKHPIHGYQLLSPISYLHPAIEIPHYHHEKWDGTGYPYGLKGEEIPLAARIFAVVDVWDALLNDRPYRKAWPEDQVRDYLRNQAGVHFDPKVVDAFFTLQGW